MNPGGMELLEEMRITDGMVISNLRAFYDEKEGVLAVADLHLGYEEVARQDGVYFPKVQKKGMLNDLVMLLDRYRPKAIVIDGDFKHNFASNLSQEWDEIKEIFSVLSEKVEDICLIKGNHDNFIARILPNGTRLPQERRIGGITYLHGHKRRTVKRMGVKETVVMAHEHPSVMLRDKVGAGVRLPCFLWHPEDRILVLPAFSALTKGNDVLRTGFMSPLLKEHEPGEFLGFAVSEIGLMELGRLGNLAVPDQ